MSGFHGTPMTLCSAIFGDWETPRVASVNVGLYHSVGVSTLLEVNLFLNMFGIGPKLPQVESSLVDDLFGCCVYTD